MTRYIGLDAHAESCTIAVLGPSGKRLRHERLQTSAELLKSFIKEVPRPRQLCMEDGTLSEWLFEELTPIRPGSRAANGVLTAAKQISRESIH